VARALAFGGMLLAHFAFATPGRDPGWLQAIDNSADGRAAPLFCILLGVGAGILSDHGASASTFVRRGAVLLVLGVAIWPITTDVFLILPQYGVLLMIMPLLRQLATRWLLPAATCAFLVPATITAFLDDHRLSSAAQPDTYAQLRDFYGTARQLVWTGGYPVVGWLGFALVGLWLARLPLGHRGVQRRLFVGGVLITATQPIAALLYEQLGAGDTEDARGLATFFDGRAHSNDFAWYVLSSGTAVAIIAACLVLAPRLQVPLRPIASLGSMMLSAYLLHLFLGAHVIWPWLAEYDPTLLTQVVVVAILFGGFAAGADLWRRRFRRGPLELLLRAVSR
jgi:uncharacterized membrane protein YeiB